MDQAPVGPRAPPGAGHRWSLGGSMSGVDYDDSDVEKQWCETARSQVARYLETQSVSHGQIGEWPAWHVAPYVSIWAVESQARPGWVGWWVICGDLPTDYVSGR